MLLQKIGITLKCEVVSVTSAIREEVSIIDLLNIILRSCYKGRQVGWSVGYCHIGVSLT